MGYPKSFVTSIFHDLRLNLLCKGYDRDLLVAIGRIRKALFPTRAFANVATTHDRFRLRRLLDDPGSVADSDVAKRVTRPGNMRPYATGLLTTGMTQRNAAEQFEVSRTTATLLVRRHLLMVTTLLRKKILDRFREFRPMGA